MTVALIVAFEQWEQNNWTPEDRFSQYVTVQIKQQLTQTILQAYDCQTHTNSTSNKCHLVNSVALNTTSHQLQMPGHNNTVNNNYHFAHNNANNAVNRWSNTDSLTKTKTNRGAAKVDVPQRLQCPGKHDDILMRLKFLSSLVHELRPGSCNTAMGAKKPHKPFLWSANRVEDFSAEERAAWEIITNTVRPEYKKLNDREKSEFSK